MHYIHLISCSINKKQWCSTMLLFVVILHNIVRFIICKELFPSCQKLNEFRKNMVHRTEKQYFNNEFLPENNRLYIMHFKCSKHIYYLNNPHNSLGREVSIPSPIIQGRGRKTQ